MKKFLVLLMVIPLLFACSSDDKEEILPDIEIELNVGETRQIDGDEFDVAKGLDKFIASFNNEGLIRANHVGNTSTLIRKGKNTFKCTIKVKANTTLYLDGSVWIGSTKDKVESVFGTSTGYNKETLFYKPIGLEKQNLFVYEASKVRMAGIDFASSFSKEIGSHLSDRYTLLGKDGNYLYYANGNTLDELNDESIMVRVEVSLSTIRIVYMKYSTTSRIIFN